MNNEIEEEYQQNKKNSETISDTNINEEEEEDDHFRTNSGQSYYANGRWSGTEHVLFLEALMLHGNEWKQVQEHIKTRSSTQARSHAQKFFIRLKKELEGLVDAIAIKERINKTFIVELKEKYIPNDKDKFLTMMLKLILNLETNTKKTPPSSSPIDTIVNPLKTTHKATESINTCNSIRETLKSMEHKQRLLIKGLKKKKESGKYTKLNSFPQFDHEQLRRLSENEQDNQTMNGNQHYYPHQHEQIFLIEKDSVKVSRKQSMASTQDQEKQVSDRHYTTLFHSLPKILNATNSETDINMFNVEDYALNNLLSNSMNPPSTTMTYRDLNYSSNPSDHDVNMMYNEEPSNSQTNPFHLDFDFTNHQKEKNENFFINYYENNDDIY